MYTIDLNSDLGESFGNYKIENDFKILDFISSANIACGFHAGDPIVIRNTIRNAISKNVAIGAHPGYPDLQGFGRRDMSLNAEEVYCYVLYQVGALKSITESEGGVLSHVKAHGALYNSAAIDYIIADAFVSACHALDKNLVIFGLPNSEIENAALKRGMEYKLEAFADRAYNSDGSLVDRRVENSVLTDSNLILERVLRMIVENRLTTVNGPDLIINPGTICIHGDNTEALEISKKLYNGLLINKIEIKNSSAN
jgi:UPF0271 protein